MISRRGMLFGAGCLVAAGAAEALRPRERMSLVAGAKLEDLIPKAFAGWKEEQTNAIVTPQSEDSLAAKLYSQIVGRLYGHPDHGYVMMLIAYGDTQNDLLQLHRPEVCYPAFGFELINNRPAEIILSKHAMVPGRALTATMSSRTEHILYWTRLGEYLPRDGSEQRMAKLKNQFAGTVPDGVLVRLSSMMEDQNESYKLNERFAGDLLRAMPAKYRRALIGTAEANQLAADITGRAAA